MELDYKAMFENLTKRFQEAMKADEEYFELLSVINEKGKYSTAIAANILRIPKYDQIKMLRILSQSAILAETLCNKYHLLNEEEE